MRITVMVLIALTLMTGAALAQKVDNTSDVDVPERFDCILTDYVPYNGPGGSVPDGDTLGVVFGLLPTEEGEVIQDVLLSVTMSATWIGDVRMWLLYDTDCVGFSDIAACQADSSCYIGQVLCRHGMTECTQDDCCGCSGDLDVDSLYIFDDTAPSIEDICPGTFTSGCYGPDYKSVGLDVFDELPSGGCWTLWVADGANLDFTEVFDWTAYVLYGGTPVKRSSWTTVKALYR